MYVYIEMPFLVRLEPQTDPDSPQGKTIVAKIYTTIPELTTAVNNNKIERTERLINKNHAINLH